MKNRKVEARQHNGSDESAKALTQWVRENKGDAYAILKGEADLESYLGDSFVIIKGTDGKISSIVRPKYWIIKIEPGVFYASYPDIFRRLYKPLKENADDQVLPKTA